MPLYSDLYGSPSTSSYTAGLYLSSPYSNHSSLVSSIYRSPVYTKPLPRTFPRNYSPHLATISENQIISPLRRKFSPKLLLEHHVSPKFKVPKPIKINTADIDVSVNKYRKYDRNSKITPDPKISPEKSKSPSPSAPEEQPPELPDNKPIRRDRALVRLHTVHKRDSPRKNLNQNGETPKSWRSNFYADELFKVDEKKPQKRSPGELLMDKFLIRTKEEEDRLRAEGRKLPRKQPVQKTSSFHDICTHISSDAIDENEDLNPGQPPEITRRQSKGEDILEEDENNNTKRKKKVTKKKSNEKLVPEEHKTNLHRRHTHKKIKRTSTDTSIVSEDEEIARQEAIKDISQVEIEEVKKPKFTATVDIDNVEHSPSLKAIIDEVEIVESPSQTLLGKKFKFNVTVEEIKETPNKAKVNDLPESKLNVLDSAMAVKREKSKSPARDFTKPKSLDLKTTTTDAKSDLKASPAKDNKADLKSPDSPTSPKTPKSKVIAKKVATSPKSPTSKIASTANDAKIASPTKVKDLKSPQEENKIISTKCDDKTTSNVAVAQIPDEGVEAKKQSSISITLTDNKILSKVDNKSPTETSSDLAAKSSAIAEKKQTKIPEEASNQTVKKPEETPIASPKIQDLKLQKSQEKIALKTSEVKTPEFENAQVSSPKTPVDVKAPKLEDKIVTPKTQEVKLPKAEETKISTIKTPQELKTCEGTQISPKPALDIKAQKSEDIKIALKTQESKAPEISASKMQNNKTPKPDETKITAPKDIKIPTSPISPKSIKEEIVAPLEKSPKLVDVKTPVLAKTLQESARPTTPTTPTTPDNLKTSKLLEAQKKVKAQKTKITPKLAAKEDNTSGENFWAKLGTRETVYLDHRRKKLQEKRFATLILPEENDEEEADKVTLKPTQNKLTPDKEKDFVKDKLKVEVKKDEANKSVDFNKLDLNKPKENAVKLPEKSEVGKQPQIDLKTTSQIEAKLIKQPDNKAAEDLIKAKLDVVDNLGSSELKTNKLEAKPDKAVIENLSNLKPEIKDNKANAKLEDVKKTEKISITKTDVAAQVDKSKDKDKLEDKFKTDDKTPESAKPKENDVKIKKPLEEAVKAKFAEETLKSIDATKIAEVKTKQILEETLKTRSAEETLKAKPVDTVKIEPIEAKTKKPLVEVLKNKSVEETLKAKSLDAPKIEAIEAAIKKPLETSKAKSPEEILKVKPVDAAKVEVIEAKAKKPLEEALKTKLIEETLKVKPVGSSKFEANETKTNEEVKPVVAKSSEAVKIGTNEAKIKKPLEETLKAKSAEETLNAKLDAIKVEANEVKTKKEDAVKIINEIKARKIEAKIIEDKSKSVVKPKIEAKNEAPKSPLLAKLDKTLLKSEEVKEVKKAKPKKEKAEEKKKDEPLKSVITNVCSPAQNAELSCEEKKLVSKRSLLNKDTIEDPDLNVFVVPTPRTPTPPPTKEPPQFVPLQSNRLTQWMHPYKKPEQYDECPVQLYARPKTIRHRHYPRPRHALPEDPKPEDEEEEEESESDEENDDVEEDVEEESSESGSEGSSDEETSDSVDYEAINDVWGYGKVGASTSSDDSGFDSSSLDNRKNKDCDVNCHKKCEKLTANLCGVNQKLIVEAIESVKKGNSERDSPTSNPAHNPAFALDPAELAEEFSQSSTFAGFQKSGRITPPATTIPRFRKYNIEDFNFLKVLGKGSFGKVLLAELKDTEYYYAIKCLKKDVVLEDDDVECTLIERKVLALGTKHPYLCHLLCTFQTESHLFFVMEYLNGGDLMFHIQLSGRFPEPRARFYAAEIVSGLKFLHSKGIVYRDLKLDNILLDFDGHVRIADFGMCKLQIFLDRTADTFCGTPDYMAPEIIKGLHYNQMVDWWSFGVLLYEMLIGQSPFSGCDEDELFWSICNERPVLPRFLSKEASKILTLFLEKDGAKRLGNKFCPEGDIQDQQFFHHIDWDLLNLRQLEPPFKPNLQHPLDTQYFDRTFTLEKAKLTPIDKNILQSMDQAQFQGFSYTNPNATDR